MPGALCSGTGSPALARRNLGLLLRRCSGQGPHLVLTGDPRVFRCARPSGVPRGPATSTGSLASQSLLCGLSSPPPSPPPSRHREQSPALTCNLNGRLDFPGPRQEETCIPRCNSRILPQLEKKHVGPPSALDEALAHYSISREVPGSVLKCETVLGTLDATRKVTRIFGCLHTPGPCAFCKEAWLLGPKGRRERS